MSYIFFGFTITLKNNIPIDIAMFSLKLFENKGSLGMNYK